jgi:murein tripeptide amidase MpaA
MHGRFASIIATAIALTLILSGSMARAEGDAVAPYAGYRWVVAHPRDARELLALQQLGEPMNCIPAPGRLELVVPPDALPALAELAVPYEVLAADVQTLVNADYALNEAARTERGGASFFAAYRTLTEINAHLDTLDTLPGQPADLVTKFDAAGPTGTIQGRRIYGIRITSPNNPLGAPKPQFLITAVQHAREWAAGSSAMYVADQLARGYGSDSAITTLLDNVEFIIIPICNPDGYVYTFPTAQGGSNQRLWRKNRRSNSGGSFGVDLNRNWATGWGLNGGSSSSSSSDTYRGAAAFSEPETASLRDFISTLPRLKGHIDFHTYSQLVLSPWGYTTATPPRINELTGLTAAMVAAIEAPYGTDWIGGPASTTLYIASGVAPDWTFEQRGALAWTYEMRDTGFYGFQLPPDQIIPTAIEAFAGVKVLANHLQTRLQIIVTSQPNSLVIAQNASFPVQITTANQYTIAAGSAKLLWRNGGSGNFNEAPLTGSAPVFTATIPGQPCGSNIQYYVQATASDGLVVRNPASTNFTAATPPCPTCPGDADGDRAVTFGDVTSVLANFGSAGAAGIPGDSDADGLVTFSDVTSVLANFGSTCP